MSRSLLTACTAVAPRWRHVPATGTPGPRGVNDAAHAPGHETAAAPAARLGGLGHVRRRPVPHGDPRHARPPQRGQGQRQQLATISAPAGFTATATGGTTATLSWTAPPTLTGYTLSQSPGTLAGCSAAPSAGPTSCTATSLSPKTSYTWNLTAVDHNWTSPAATTSATTFAVFSATLKASTTDSTGGTSSSTVTGVTTTSGADLLILVYRQGSNGNLGINSISGTAISGTPTAVNSQVFDPSSKYEVWAYRATGSGTSNGTATVSFSAPNNKTTTIDVVQLSGDKAASPIASSAVSSGTSGTTVTGGTLSGASPSDGEVFFTGLAGSTTMSTPSGYTALDAPASAVHGAWFSSAASSAGITTNLGAGSAWGTIEIEINHG